MDDLPLDDRWFLAYDPNLNMTGYETKPWVIATRCDGGFRTEDGHWVHPQRWEPLPDPQPAPTGWRWPTGKIIVCRARINETRWSGWMACTVDADGNDDDREPYLSSTRKAAVAWAEKFASWSGLPIEFNDAEFDNVVPFRTGAK